MHCIGQEKNIKYQDPVEHTAVGMEPVEATFRKLERIIDMLISSVCLLIALIWCHSILIPYMAPYH